MKSRLSKGLRKKRRNRSQRASQHSRFRGLRVETLEDRRLLTAFGGVDSFGSVAGGAEGEASGSDPSYVPNQLLMRFTAGTSDALRDQVLNEEGATILKEYQSVPIVLVELPDMGMDINGQSDYWTSKPEVKYAEPNYIQQILGRPNDTRFGEMWGLNNTGQTGGVPDADVDAPEAWDIFTGSSDVVVAINDTGIEYDHEDIVDNMWVNPGEIAGDGIDNDGNGYIDDIYGIDPVNADSDPMDGHSHGTHVAGTVGATGNNALGVTGVNWDVSLMAIKVCSDAGLCPQSAQIEGLDYITTMKTRFGINIVASNHSYGGLGAPSQAVFDAIAAHNAADVVFVAASGNDSTDTDVVPHYPSSYDLEGIISVAATDDSDQLAGFSNFGATTVDLAAPGDNILSTVLSDGYDLKSGTSMASPHVAGAVGLVRGMAPALSGLEAKQLIMEGVDLLPALSGKMVTGGRLNLFGTLSRVTPSQIQGLVWQDENANGVREAGEAGIENWTVYVDLNNNGNLDQNEPSAVTIADGTYTIESFTGPGTYTVAQVLQPLWEHTFPASGTQTVRIVNRDDVITGVNFGNRPVRGGVSGIKWNDLDSDGVHDPDEPGMQGIYIYVDLNNNGSIALGEPAAITDANGAYNIQGVPPGQVTVRESLNPGWVITYPALGYHLVDITPAATTPNVDFGNAVNLDFGDAPAPYPTLAEEGGASHGVLPGFQLGLLVDGEQVALPEANAVGDDLSNLADEDGVEFTAPLFADKIATINVTVSTGPYSPGALQGWVDFNADGDWSDPGEQIITDMVLNDGVYPISFPVPADSAVGTSFARFRYGYERGIGPTGAALAGEVEDHAVLILKDEPVANDDNYDVPQDSIDVSLDVLANDFPSSSGVLSIVGVTQPARGRVVIAPDAQSVLFTPNRGTFSPPTEDFTYTINDGTGNTDTANVTVFVTPEIVQPVAVDDAYRVAVGSSDNVLQVLDNDLPGILGTMQLTSVTDPPSGTATIDNNGTPADPLDDFIRYTPDASFSVMDQFQYTISNANGSSQATVTIFETPSPGGQGVEISLAVTDLAGNPISQIGLGQEFMVVASVQDTRVSPTVAGVAAAYFDVLFDRDLVLPNVDPSNPLGFDIVFSDDYLNAQSGNARTPGIVDEVGSFQTLLGPLGSAKLELFQVTFTSIGAGTVEFTGDPADISPAHDVLFFDPPAAVPLPEISYGFTSLNISGSGSSSSNPLDVNIDGYVSPIDALLVINNLNLGGGIASHNGGTPLSQLDVNRDRMISPLDALLVINYINLGGSGEGEGGSLLSAPAAHREAARPSLLSDPADSLTTLDVSRFSPQIELATSALVAPDSQDVPRRVDRSPSAAADWQTQIGVEPAAAAGVPSADQIVDQGWENLLDSLAEDVLEAWLDGDA